MTYLLLPMKSGDHLGKEQFEQKQKSLEEHLTSWWQRGRSCAWVPGTCLRIRQVKQRSLLVCRTGRTTYIGALGTTLARLPPPFLLLFSGDWYFSLCRG
jgi:hypothetical protein